MNLKHFLKPDWRKLLITITLSIIIFLITELLIKMGIAFTYFMTILENQQVYSLIILTDILYWYILSCIIIWIHDKAKKLKSQPESDILVFLKHNF